MRKRGGEGPEGEDSLREVSTTSGMMVTAAGGHTHHLRRRPIGTDVGLPAIPEVVTVVSHGWLCRRREI